MRAARALKSATSSCLVVMEKKLRVSTLRQLIAASRPIAHSWSHASVTSRTEPGWVLVVKVVTGHVLIYFGSSRNRQHRLGQLTRPKEDGLWRFLLRWSVCVGGVHRHRFLTVSGRYRWEELWRF